MKKEVKLEIDLEKFRYSLVGDGYLLEEVVKMTEEELVNVLKDRVTYYINIEYYKSKQFELLDGTR